jgi:hypothetical protein
MIETMCNEILGIYTKKEDQLMTAAFGTQPKQRLNRVMDALNFDYPDYEKLDKGACGGQISPGSTRRLEDLVKGFGPDISQGHPFVGQGRNAWRSGSAQDRINLSPDRPTDLSDIHSSDPTFPRCVLRHQN